MAMTQGSLRSLVGWYAAEGVQGSARSQCGSVTGLLQSIPWLWLRALTCWQHMGCAAAASRLLAVHSLAELCAPTCALHCSTAALAHSWAQEAGRDSLGAVVALPARGCLQTPLGMLLWAGRRSCWGAVGSPMPSLCPGAVAGAAGSEAKDQERCFHRAHGPQVPTAVVPGECSSAGMSSGGTSVAPEEWLLLAANLFKGRRRKTRVSYSVLCV